MNKPNVFELIERMAALIRSEERKKCAEFGLQAVHFQMLDYLSRCNKYSDTPAALTNYLGMTRGTVSQTLLLLETKGFIKKTTDNKDRRVVHLSLLPVGEAILEKTKPLALFEQATTHLPTEQFAQYHETLATMLTALQKSNQSFTFGLCKTCQYFTNTTNGLMCGLTQETLTESDSEKVCQEHKAA